MVSPQAMPGGKGNKKSCGNFRSFFVWFGLSFHQFSSVSQGANIAVDASAYKPYHIFRQKALLSVQEFPMLQKAGEKDSASGRNDNDLAGYEKIEIRRVFHVGGDSNIGFHRVLASIMVIP